jgi:hypothetical protein
MNKATAAASLALVAVICKGRAPARSVRYHTSALSRTGQFVINPQLDKGQPLTDFDRFRLACSQIVGKRLTWDVLTG